MLKSNLIHLYLFTFDTIKAVALALNPAHLIFTRTVFFASSEYLMSYLHGLQIILAFFDLLDSNLQLKR